MIEETVISFLSGKLDVPVYAEDPDTVGEAFCIVEKTSSGRENYIDSAIVTVKSCAGSMYEAAELNESVKEAMDTLTELSTVSACRLNGDYRLVDTTKKRYRYQAAFKIVY